MEFSETDDKKVIIIGYKDESIDKCIDFEHILRYANDPELKDEIDKCFTHRLFSH
ncbi:MAG: hypothetical protein ACFFKA_19100 [Candidatus Thorarchaeota archaeon]